MAELLPECILIYFKTELQIRGVIEVNSKIIFLISQKNICCDPSLEPSRPDSSNGGSQLMFYGKIWKIMPLTPSYLEHCQYKGTWMCPSLNRKCHFRSLYGKVYGV